MRNFQSVKNAIRDKYAWPGGYPMYLIMSDGEALCVDCGRSEYKLICRATIQRDLSGWSAVAADINYEDNDLFCAHCSAKIESAYGDDD